MTAVNSRNANKKLKRIKIIYHWFPNSQNDKQILITYKLRSSRGEGQGTKIRNITRLVPTWVVVWWWDKSLVLRVLKWCFWPFFCNNKCIIKFKELILLWLTQDKMFSQYKTHITNTQEDTCHWYKGLLIQFPENHPNTDQVTAKQLSEHAKLIGWYQPACCPHRSTKLTCDNQAESRIIYTYLQTPTE